MCEFCIGREGSEYLRVRVLARAHPESGDWEVNWLNAEVEIWAGGFRGRLGANLLAGELSTLRADLSRLYSFESREAAFDAYDGRLSIKIKGDGLGNFAAECEALDGVGNRLTFSLLFDQTEIPPTLKGLDAVLKEFPFIGRGAV
jgi:hypothetical protein